MRPFNLARIAVEAEILRWQSFASRIVTRLALAVFAVVFLLGALTLAHVVAWHWLETDWGIGTYWSALLVGGFDLLVAIILLWLAGRSQPSRTEREAVEVRQRAVAGLKSPLSVAAFVIPALRLGTRRR